MKKTETFASLFQTFAYRHRSRTLFDDFLTVSIAAFARNYETGLSYDEDLYLKTVSKYPDAADMFPQLLALLINEMEERTGSSLGNDVLGDFFEQNIAERGKSQFFTPWPICQFMAKNVVSDKENQEPIRVLDPACGSGRTLLAAANEIGSGHHYYGIDIDETCVKMTAINLFLNGRFRSEVMCANSLMPEDFRVSYKVSFLPLGIYRITNKEESELWHMHRSSFNKKPEAEIEPTKNKGKGDSVSQLKLF